MSVVELDELLLWTACAVACACLVNFCSRREPASVDPPIRIWMDGAFDMMHHGHVNAFRQGRALGTHLVVGVNDDESISQCKGPPVMGDRERVTAVQSCRFVDEVVPGVPYVMDDEYLSYVVRKYRIDYVVHGDDACLVNGRDVYASARAAGKYRTIPRTDGVSSTDIVGRMLLMSTEHHSPSSGAKPALADRLASQIARDDEAEIGDFASASAAADADEGDEVDGPGATSSSVSPLHRLRRVFAAAARPRPPRGTVVYIAGAWDMFHAGHIMTLERARELGDFLVVGVHSDEVVNSQRGANMPVMNLDERVLCVLGCKYVDDVLVDAPRAITPDLLDSLRISVVASGTRGDASLFFSNDGDDPFEVPKRLGIYRQIPSASDLSVVEIANRIQQHHSAFDAKYRKKIKAQDAYYASRREERAP